MTTAVRILVEDERGGIRRRLPSHAGSASGRDFASKRALMSFGTSEPSASVAHHVKGGERMAIVRDDAGARIAFRNADENHCPQHTESDGP